MTTRIKSITVHPRSAGDKERSAIVELDFTFIARGDVRADEVAWAKEHGEKPKSARRTETVRVEVVIPDDDVTSEERAGNAAFLDWLKSKAPKAKRVRR